MVHVRDDRNIAEIHDTGAFRFLGEGPFTRVRLQAFPEKSEGLIAVKVLGTKCFEDSFYWVV